jgi:hypothetical protein
VGDTNAHGLDEHGLNGHGLDDLQLTEVLTHGELDIEGRLVDASNLAVVAVAHLDGASVRCVYKPSAGERPLWDFDTATLSRREVAAYQVSCAAGWNIVPVTAWRDDGPAGEGMCQVWIDVDEQAGLVDIVPLGAVPEGWKHVIDAEGSTGRPVTLVHADHQALRNMAAFDAVVNNADRKGGHVLVDLNGQVFGIDHGVTFNEEDKLRTVLWGWAGEPLDDSIIEALARLDESLQSPTAVGLRRLLTRQEIRITRDRVREISSQARFPYPGDGWPSLPWPAF